MQQGNVVRLLVSLALGAIATGCSADGDGSGPGRGGGPMSNGNAGASAGASAAGSAGMAFGNSDAPVGSGPTSGSNAAAGDAATSEDEPLSEGNACGTGSVSAELTPVNMFVMFDRSGSMEDEDKWPNATAALTSFFQNPGTDGLRVALRFFPHDEPASGCTEDGCDAVACSQPLVPIGTITADPAPMDTHEAALVDAIENSAPNGGGGGGGGGQGTPIYAALDGALRWAMDYQAMHPDEKTVVIFLTDGEPNGCDEDFNNISALAADALASTGVTTYAIGLQGSSEAQMDQLAQAGGTMSGIFIDNSANAEQELLAALNAIRGATLSCDFPIPEPSDPNMPIDPGKVNVTFTSGAGMAATLLQVPDASACGTSSSWHYDTAQGPTRIFLCPAACDLVREDAAGELQVLLGCETACSGLDVDCDPGDVPPGLPPPIVD